MSTVQAIGSRDDSWSATECGQAGAVESGVPDKIATFDDLAWHWNGARVDQPSGPDGGTVIGKAADRASA